jgi:hypothetical protein
MSYVKRASLRSCRVVVGRMCSPAAAEAVGCAWHWQGHASLRLLQLRCLLGIDMDGVAARNMAEMFSMLQGGKHEQRELD